MIDRLFGWANNLNARLLLHADMSSPARCFSHWSRDNGKNLRGSATHGSSSVRQRIRQLGGFSPWWRHRVLVPRSLSLLRLALSFAKVSTGGTPLVVRRGDRSTEDIQYSTSWAGAVQPCITRRKRKEDEVNILNFACKASKLVWPALLNGCWYLQSLSALNGWLPTIFVVLIVQCHECDFASFYLCSRFTHLLAVSWLKWSQPMRDSTGSNSMYV